MVQSSPPWRAPESPPSVTVRASDPSFPPEEVPTTSTTVFRRSARETAGQHRNIHHLPEPVGVVASRFTTSQVLGSGSMDDRHL